MSRKLQFFYIFVVFSMRYGLFAALLSQQLKVPQTFVYFIVDHSNVYQRIASGRVPENPLELYKIVILLVKVIAKCLSGRVAADSFLHARRAADRI